MLALAERWPKNTNQWRGNELVCKAPEQGVELVAVMREGAVDAHRIVELNAGEDPQDKEEPCGILWNSAGPRMACAH